MVENTDRCGMVIGELEGDGMIVQDIPGDGMVIGRIEQLTESDKSARPEPHNSAWTYNHHDLGIAFDEINEEVRKLNKVLKWLRSASTEELMGYRDGYDSLTGEEVVVRSNLYGKPYTDAFMKGVSVSPLVNG